MKLKVDLHSFHFHEQLAGIDNQGDKWPRMNNN